MAWFCVIIFLESVHMDGFVEVSAAGALIFLGVSLLLLQKWR
jgi:hypothetical protein